MSLLLKILALLSQLQNLQLVQDIEQCVITNTSAAAIWACILGKLNGHPTVTAHDMAHIEAAKTLATAAKL